MLGVLEGKLKRSKELDSHKVKGVRSDSMKVWTAF